MRIGILGTRGIPNNYGGFEQFAQNFSKSLSEKGHIVYVYCSSNHKYKKNLFQGINLIHCYDPEKHIGTIGQFVYDLNCILDSRQRKYDILLYLGYTSSSIWSLLNPSESIIITNMDGLEWKRNKYNFFSRRFLKFAERLAVRNSHFLISDSIGIKTYLLDKYKKKSKYIPYGADVFKNPSLKSIEELNIKPHDYHLIVARLEPENNIELIINGYLAAKISQPIIIVGNNKTKYGQKIKRKYHNYKQVRFLGGIYDQYLLNNIRFFSKIYFHGHSVGGTNPSLLEAMASCDVIAANDNIFNKAILGQDAFYFKNEQDIYNIVTNYRTNTIKNFKKNNILKIQNTYSNSKINNDYLAFFKSCIENEIINK